MSVPPPSRNFQPAPEFGRWNKFLARCLRGFQRSKVAVPIQSRTIVYRGRALQRFPNVVARRLRLCLIRTEPLVLYSPKCSGLNIYAFMIALVISVLLCALATI